MELVGGVFLLGIWVVFGSLACLGTILWIWMLVDCLMNEPSEGNEKIIWVIVILLTHWIGALIYLFARRPQRIAQYGK